MVLWKKAAEPCPIRTDDTHWVVMPELPEVENVVRSLRPNLVGRRILDIELPSSAGGTSNGRAAKRRVNGKSSGRSKDQGKNRGGDQGKEKTSPILRRLLATPVEEFLSGLRGARVESVRRHGKNVLIAVRKDNAAEGDPSEDTCLLVHLGMTGRLLFESTPEPTRSHTHLIFNLDAPGSWLHFSDPRRFGKLRLISNQESDSISELGPDPLEIPLKDFTERLRGRRTMIKALLLDQRFLRGLGNIYADESLFRAGIHPSVIAARLNRERAMRLYQGIRETLAQAIDLGGSSISSYVDAQGRQGRFQRAHQVYQRTGQPCFQCGTPIRRMVIASRSTHFCSRCQTGRRSRAARPSLSQAPSRDRKKTK